MCVFVTLSVGNFIIQIFRGNMNAIDVIHFKFDHVNVLLLSLRFGLLSANRLFVVHYWYCIYCAAIENDYY